MEKNHKRNNVEKEDMSAATEHGAYRSRLVTRIFFKVFGLQFSRDGNMSFRVWPGWVYGAGDEQYVYLVEAFHNYGLDHLMTFLVLVLYLFKETSFTPMLDIIGSV